MKKNRFTANAALAFLKVGWGFYHTNTNTNKHTQKNTLFPHLTFNWHSEHSNKSIALLFQVLSRSGVDICKLSH